MWPPSWMQAARSWGSAILNWTAYPACCKVSHRGGGTVWLYGGGRRLRAATGQERQTLPVISVWGRQVIVLLAERHLAGPER